MTLEEVWENLKQDTETKATMEEVEKSYKLFKKIENLIVADLEAKLAESEYKVQTLLKSKDVLAVTDIAKMSVDNFNLRKENEQLKQQSQNWKR